MANLRTAAILLSIAALFGYELSRGFVPENMEKPALYRGLVASFRLCGYAGKAGAAMNLGTEMQVFRSALSSLGGLLKFLPQNENVDIKTQLLGNIPVRVYSPKTKTAGNLPIMIYYHGGGFILGAAADYDLFLTEFVTKLNMVIVSVDYNLAPEHPFKTPISDCYSATKYILKNPKEFNADLSRLVVAGDSAGGNLVAVLTQKLLEDKLTQPKIQLLIYPWTQMFNSHLPSMIEYAQSGLSGQTFSLQRMAAMYMGVNDATDEIENAIIANNHTALLTDATLKAKIKSYLDVAQIPDKYKTGKRYYDSYEIRKPNMYPDHLDRDNVLVKDSELAGILKKLYDPQVSPLFAEDSKLQGLPKAYFVILEWDSLKDEGLLYAERLKKNGVPVHVAFYEDAFHAIITFPDENFGFQKARDIRNDMIKYLKSNL